MSNEPVVVNENESALSNINYENMEAFATNAVSNLSNTMDALLEVEEGTAPTVENIDRAIDCADAMVKVLAMFHKGREIEAKREQVNKGIALSGSH